MASLPTIRVPLTAICDTGYHPADFSKTLVGQAYFYDWNKVTAAAQSADMNFDHLMTAFLATGFARKPVKREVLIWFAAISGKFWLWACSKDCKANTEWMADLPGFEESGRDHVRPNALPIGYWDKQNFHRVYVLEKYQHGDAYHVCDFGNLMGLSISGEPKETWERIRNAPAQHVDYSAVPQEAEEVIDFGGKKVAVTHAILEAV